MYDSDSAEVSDSLENSDSPVFTREVIDTIIELGGSTVGGGTEVITLEEVTVPAGGVITVGAGTDIVFVTGSDTIQTTIIPPTGTDTNVFIFQGAGGIDVLFNDGNTGGGDGLVDRVIVGTSGDDNIVLGDGQDTQVILGTGDSTVVGGAGDDTIMAGLGNSTIDGGQGNDIVVLRGGASDFTIHRSFSPASAEAGLPQAASTDYVVITNAATGITTQITGLQYVQLDGADALIFAESTVEAGVAALYHAAFGRTGEAGGIQYWFDRAKSGESLSSLAYEFTHSAEFQAAAGLSNTDFINALYQNTFGRTADAGGLAYWSAQMGSGATRADLLAQFASVAALNVEGNLDTEAVVVGSVTIVHNVI